MPYITSVERIGMRKGLEQGRQGDIIRILEFRLGNIPPELREIIGKIKNEDLLGNLLIQAITIQSVSAFQSVVSQYITEPENSDTSS